MYIDMRCISAAAPGPSVGSRTGGRRRGLLQRSPAASRHRTISLGQLPEFHVLGHRCTLASCSRESCSFPLTAAALHAASTHAHTGERS